MGFLFYLSDQSIYRCANTRLSFFYSNWSKIALQRCVSFCCTMKWISYMYTYVPSLLDHPPTHPHPTHLDRHRAPNWAPCAIQQVPTIYPFYTWKCIYVKSNLPVRPTLPCPPRVHMSVLYICVSIPVLQIGSSVPFF